MNKTPHKYELCYSIESLFICEIVDYTYDKKRVNIIRKIAESAVPYLKWGKN
jgi:hypothetical protein